MRRFGLIALFSSLMVFAQPWQAMESTLTGSSSALNNGTGHSWADVDGDGDFDLFLNGSQNLWINRVNENNTFEQRQDLLPPLAGSGWAACFGDFDNDGDPDIHLGNSGTDFLLENRWPEPFVNVGPQFALTDPKWNQSVNWADYNKDGLLDLYITHERPGTDGPHHLYQNNFPGPFLPRFPLNGSDPDIVGLADKNSHAYGLAWADIDLDGDLDVVTSACGSASTIPNEDPHNKIYRNQFPAPVFEDLSLATGLVDPPEVLNGSDSYWGLLFDYNRDRFPDLFIGATAGGNGQHRIWVNTGIFPGDFGIDLVPNAVHNVGGNSAFLKGATAGDYDNDGDLDICTTSEGLYENLGDGSFQLRANLVGTGGSDVSFVDYDRDGHLDIFNFTDIYRNPGGYGNNWIAIELVGAGVQTGTPRSAHNVKIGVRAGGDWQYREHRFMVGSYSQHMLPTHFGLGTASIVDQISITWMSGVVELFNNVAVNQYITFTETVNCTETLTLAETRYRYCFGDAFNLTVDRVGKQPVAWYVIDGPTIDPIQFGSPTDLNTTFTPAMPGRYQIGVRFQRGCPDLKRIDFFDSDFNGDGVYDFNDTLAAIPYWNQDDGTFPYDLDGDGSLTIRDLLSVCQPSPRNRRADNN